MLLAPSPQSPGGSVRRIASLLEGAEARAADLLERAADRVASGWCQLASAQDLEGHSVDPSSIRSVRWCAVGAIVKAGEASDLDVIARAISMLAAWLARQGFVLDQGSSSGTSWETALAGVVRIAEWNDHPSRTAEEVAHALRAAARGGAPGGYAAQTQSALTVWGRADQPQGSTLVGAPSLPSGLLSSRKGE